MISRWGLSGFYPTRAGLRGTNYPLKLRMAIKLQIHSSLQYRYRTHFLKYYTKYNRYRCTHVSHPLINQHRSISSKAGALNPYTIMISECIKNITWVFVCIVISHGHAYLSINLVIRP